MSHHHCSAIFRSTKLVCVPADSTRPVKRPDSRLNRWFPQGQGCSRLGATWLGGVAFRVYTENVESRGTKRSNFGSTKLFPTSRSSTRPVVRSGNRRSRSSAAQRDTVAGAGRASSLTVEYSRTAAAFASFTFSWSGSSFLSASHVKTSPSHVPTCRYLRSTSV